MTATSAKLSARAWALATALLLLVGLASVAAPSARADENSLLRSATSAAPQAQQIITVTAASASSTTAQLSAWIPKDGQWSRVFGPITAHLGSQGIGAAQDEVPRTPQGVWSLDQAFGRQANPGSAMPYFQATRSDWWDGSASSPTYDRQVNAPSSPGNGSENLYDAGPVYDYAVHFDNNPSHTPGKGSAFFLHVTDGNPTAGCVAVDRQSMISILKWLSPAYKPVIAIGT
ncbi:L,D-transpeptidase family protein [Tsukamurella sp. 8F]|uniref:L,D-transpeptidase family protein n=1 Tax=unclassified Tsukamurella TaxID=2633480 RepID=UPI0023B978DB|nr:MULTISPECIES: L,D-transpeptidase family protein [unclassified Tsukamurella]MDF0532567.1 L,D-transpeptidase family protein [Tsukamurella sp. 8J]MDF0585904.1 L,D-transpeptidase family protein [Tsukamurella sp. 8F]